MLSLLHGGEVDKALELIETRDRELLASPVAMYCKSPVVNAALDVYAQMAKKDGVRVVCEVDMDERNDFREGDNDLAILLSNVMENAVIASRAQPEGAREIRVSLAYTAGQYALVAENRYDAPILMGADGLPMTRERGHGTGMISLRHFAEKYDASVIFEQRDGWARLWMYWDGAEPGADGKVRREP